MYEEIKQIAIVVFDKSSFWALIGVFLGGLLSPYIAARFEDRKTKRLLKPNLINALSRYHDYIKNKKELTKHDEKYRINSNALWEDAKEPGLTDEQRRHKQWIVDSFDSRIAHLAEEIRFFSEKVIEAESEIHSIVAQVKDYYSKNVYNKINNIITDYFVAHSEAMAEVDLGDNKKLVDNIEWYFQSVNTTYFNTKAKLLEVF